MKKIPTLFERVYENHKIVGITEVVTPGFEWVLAGGGISTIKYDGSCCAIINGELYKRYDDKKGKKTSSWSDSLLCPGFRYGSLAPLGKVRSEQSV